MVHVDLDKILTEEDTFTKIHDLVSDVENSKELYVITKNGKPAAALVNIDYFEELTGDSLQSPVPSSKPVEPSSPNKAPGTVKEDKTGSNFELDTSEDLADQSPLIEEEPTENESALNPTIPPVSSEPTPTTPPPAPSILTPQSTIPTPPAAPIPTPPPAAPASANPNSSLPPFVPAADDSNSIPPDNSSLL